MYAPFNLLWYFRKLMPGSGLMKIFTTKYPFLCRHFTVFRNRAEPKLRASVGAAGQDSKHVCAPSLIDDVSSELSHKQVERAARTRQRLRVAHDGIC